MRLWPGRVDDAAATLVEPYMCKAGLLLARCQAFGSSVHRQKVSFQSEVPGPSGGFVSTVV